MKLSIIVPVYNVEKYLAKCLDSLLRQNIQPADYEIIVVIDGATDNSEKVAQSYADKYPQIILVKQQNLGLSAARNTGISKAKGTYFMFVDSDDYLEPNVLGFLLNKMEVESLDILRFNYQNVNEAYQTIHPYKNPKQFVDYKDEVKDGITFLTENLGFACYAWQFIINKEILIQNQILFKEGIYFEDTEWTPRLLAHAQRVNSVKMVVYNYLLRSGSITNSINEEKQQKVLNDKLLLIDSLLEQQKKQFDTRWFKGMISATVMSFVSYVALNFYNQRKFYLQALKLKKIFPLNSFHATRRNRIRILLINISPAFYCWFIHIKNKK